MTNEEKRKSNEKKRERKKRERFCRVWEDVSNLRFTISVIIILRKGEVSKGRRTRH